MKERSGNRNRTNADSLFHIHNFTFSNCKKDNNSIYEVVTVVAGWENPSVQHTQEPSKTRRQSSQVCVDHSPTGWGQFFFVWDCVNESVYIWDPKKEKDRKQREKGVNEQKGCSESSDPKRKHSDESPDNGFSVELLELAAADPQHLRPRTRQLLPTIHTGGGPSSGRNERRDSTTNSKTEYQTTFLMMIKAGIQNHILPE